MDGLAAANAPGRDAEEGASAAPPSWTEDRKAELTANRLNGQVGNVLVLENDRVRVWSLRLQPGERLPFHTHVLDYFWTATTSGSTRTHFGDGRIETRDYAVGDTRYFTFAAGEFLFHDTENIGSAELQFTTVEFLDSANRALDLPTSVRRSWS